MTKSTLNAAADIAATIGEWSAILSLIAACVIGFFLIIIGFILMIKGKGGAGVALIVFTFLMIGLAYVYYKIVTSHKGIAAIAGIVTVVDFVSDGGGGDKRVMQNKVN